MIRSRFMTSIAALALLAGTSVAFGQSPGGAKDTPSTGTSTQHSPSTAPQSGSESSHTQMNRSQPSENSHGSSTLRQELTQSGENARGSHQNARDQDMRSNETKGRQSSEERSKGDRTKSSESDRMRKNDNMNAERHGTDTQNDTQRSETRSQTTTGQAGAGAKLSTEQRTKITSVIREQHVQPEGNVNFNISVGTRVPRTVHFHPLPADIVTVYPDWRGYEFFLVRDQIIVVNPRTFEIVAVLEA